MNRHPAPAPLSSVSNFFPASTSLSTNTGTAPSRAQPLEMASPIPFAPPVIRTILSLSCKSIVIRLQSIKPNRIQTKDFFFIFSRMLSHVAFDKFFHLPVVRRQQAHRPIGTEHQTVRTECFEHRIQIRFHILGFPILPIRFRDEPGNLAIYIVVLRERPHISGPRLALAVFNLRLCQMVDHEPLLRKLCGKFDGCRELSSVNEDVVGVSELTQSGNSACELPSNQKIVVGLCLGNVPESAKLFEPGEELQSFGKAR